MQEMQEIQVRFLGQEDLMEKEMTTHSSILAWKILWTEEPGGLHLYFIRAVVKDRWLQSHSEVLGIRTSAYGFGWSGTLFHPWHLASDHPCGSFRMGWSDWAHWGQRGGGSGGAESRVDSVGSPSRGTAGGRAGVGHGGKGVPSFRRPLVVTLQASDSEDSETGWIWRKISAFLLVDFWMTWIWGKIN